MVRIFRNPNIGTRLLFWFGLVGLLPLTVITVMSYYLSSQSLTEEVTSALSSIADGKAQQIDLYASERQKDVTIFARQAGTIGAVDQFTQAFIIDGLDAEQYQAVDRQYRQYLEDYVQGYNYEDLFLISKGGEIVFSVKRGEDLGSNLYSGIYKDTELAKVYLQSQTLLEANFSDFAYYAPTNEPAAFIAAPVMKDNELIGAVALQINNKALYTTVNDYTGLGLTGEIQVGSKSGDKIIYLIPLRNDPYAAFRTTTIIGSDTGLAIQQAVRGLAGNAITTDYRGKEVIAAWRYIPGLRWGMVVKIDTEEAFAPIAALRNAALIMGGLSLLTVLITAVLVSRSISRPIVSLTDVAKVVSGGDINAQAIVESTDEIGTLASAFNAMTARLREFIGTLEQRVTERTQALANVAEISTATSQIQNLDEMLARVVFLTQRRFGLYHAHVFLLDSEGRNLEIIACGWKEGDEHEGTHGTTTISIDAEQSLVARAARTKRPVIVNDVRSDPGWLPNPLMPDTASELAVPLLIGDRVIGVLDVQSDRMNAFTDADADVQMTLGAQVAVAVQNIRQFENSQKIANDLGVVSNVGLATATITDIDRLLQEVVDLSKRSFNLYHAHIYMLNETEDALVLAAGAGEVGRQMVAEGRRIPMDAEQSLVVRAARGQQGVVVNDVSIDPNFLPNPLLPETRAEMAVPMLAAGRVIGVLDVQSETAGRFTDVDVNIKTTLASQIAVAVQNARNFERSRKQAERETAVNLISQRIQSATSVESALQIAARELGHALGMKRTVALIEAAALEGERESGA